MGYGFEVRGVTRKMVSCYINHSVGTWVGAVCRVLDYSFEARGLARQHSIGASVQGFACRVLGKGFRDNRSRALRPTRPHTAGYIGVCDQEQGVSECLSALENLAVPVLRDEG